MAAEFGSPMTKPERSPRHSAPLASQRTTSVLLDVVAVKFRKTTLARLETFSTPELERYASELTSARFILGQELKTIRALLHDRGASRVVVVSPGVSE